MTAKLSPELTNALHAAGSQPLEVIDPSTNHVYLVVDPSNPDAVDDLRKRQDLAAIAEGIRQMEAGEGQPIEEAFAEMRAELIAEFKQ